MTAPNFMVPLMPVRACHLDPEHADPEMGSWLYAVCRPKKVATPLGAHLVRARGEVVHDPASAREVTAERQRGPHFVCVAKRLARPAASLR